MPILPVAELGEKIERAWRAVNYDLAGFPDLSGNALEAGRLHERVVPHDVAEAVFASSLPVQVDPRALFGQPPVTLFRAPRFYIDALFWVDGTTAIHDHAFSGAFQVLSGPSIETRFSFAPLHDVDGHLRLGTLKVQDSVLLGTGSVRAIPSGPGYIHSLFHLAHPSVSLVVRTFRDPTIGAQFDYSPSGVGYDSFMDNPVRDRMLQVVDMLRKSEDPAFERIVGDAIATVDFHTGFSIIQACAKGSDSALVDRLVDRLTAQEHADRIRSWIRHRRRIEFLVSRRRSIRDEKLRFFLAVLLNAQCRADALALVAKFAPEVPAEKQIAAWVRQLSEMTMRLRVENADFEPNLLGLPKFGPGFEEALSDLLAGREAPRSSDERQFIATLRSLSPLACLFA